MPHIKTLNDNAHITANSTQLALLKAHFPNCFDKEGNFISHKMEEIVGKAGLDLSRESYSLNWLGKSYARLLANENPRTLLKADKAHNAKEAHKNSQNLLIKGDNLEVLKHLSHAYSEQIKMIYIDPPYNTGGDGFVYQDDRKFSSKELEKLAGIDAEEAKRILDFTSSKSNSHSEWLTFMYPRLYVARELLREDGVIFISIDDNEVSQLKLLCDEVFGEDNFVEEIIWKRRSTPPNDRIIGKNHEYILVYAKSIETIKLYLQPRTKEQEARYSNIDTRGAWVASDLSANGKGGRLSQSCIFDIKNPKTLISYSPPKNKCWLYNEEKIKHLLSEERIGFREKSGNPFLKRYLSEVRNGSTLPTILDNHGVSSNSAKELRELFKNDFFDFPKPLKLINTFLQTGSNKDDIILDFFAGSGTTAHAVMALNAEDGGNRKFITVQIAEKTDVKSEAYKVGYETIFDITKARIEKASEKLNDTSGFQIFETVEVFEGYLDELEELNAETTLFNGQSLDDEALETLLTTWKAHDGMRLTEVLEEVMFGDYKAYYAEKTVYFMDKGFDIVALKALIEKLDEDKDFEASKLVIFGYNFESKTQRELKEALSNYKNKKSIEIDMLVRY